MRYPTGASLLRPRVLLSGARAAWIGPGLDLDHHRSAVASVAIGLDQPFSLELSGRDRTLASAALIPAGAISRLRGQGRLVFVYLDALDDDVQHLDLKHPADIVARMRSALECGVDADPRTRARDGGERAGVRAAPQAHDALQALHGALGVPPRPPMPGWMTDVVRAMDKRPSDVATLADAAALANLSSSRFRHLFRQATGVPFSRYRTWCRMAAVVRSLASHGSLTRAAADAGFASASHFSTAFRQMFGLCPSRLLGAGARID